LKAIVPVVLGVQIATIGAKESGINLAQEMISIFDDLGVPFPLNEIIALLFAERRGLILPVVLKGEIHALEGHVLHEVDEPVELGRLDHLGLPLLLELLEVEAFQFVLDGPLHHIRQLGLLHLAM